jgi:putative ABC transport system permease protein
MTSIFAMALRNIGRNKRRTLLAVISVMLSMAFIVFMKAFVAGFIDSMVRNYTRQECGHVRITTKKFAERSKFFPVASNVNNPDSLIAALRQLPGVGSHIAVAAKRCMFGVLLTNKGNSKPAVALAGDPEQERTLSMLHKSLLPGGAYADGEREMIMGSTLARHLGHRVGDTVRVMANGADDALHLRKFILTGIFETKINSIDERMFQIPIADAGALLHTGKNVQQIVLFLNDYRGAGAVADAIRGALGDTTLAVMPWTEVGPYYSIVKMAEKVYGWMYAAIAFLGAFIISNIMMMVILERRKEIGILKSMGMKRRAILVLFLTEGVMMGSIGSLAGVALGTAINIVLSITGLDFSKLMAGSTIPMENVIYPQPDALSAL